MEPGTLAAGRDAPSAGDAAMLRAYTAARCVDYGCSIDDVTHMERRVSAGGSWVHTGLALARENSGRAADAQLLGHSVRASSFHLHAAACYRLAQAALEDDAVERSNVYERQARSFATGLRIGDATAVPFTVEHEGAGHACWLFPATSTRAADDVRPPCVVIWGGADGWCEAFHASVDDFRQRGLSVCLVELPGQGRARLRHGSFISSSFTRFVSKLLDQLAVRGPAKEGFGVLGHSLGGTLALVAAAHDERIVACCTNGGSVQLARGLTKYPRVLRRFGRMLGDEVTPDRALAFVDELDAERAARTMRACLLCLHGAQDVLVTTEEVRALVDLRGAAATTVRIWEEGVHCLYNFRSERNAVMADWFLQTLRPPAGSP